MKQKLTNSQNQNIYLSNHVKSKIALVSALILFAITSALIYQRISFLKELTYQQLTTLTNANSFAIQNGNFREIIENAAIQNNSYLSIKQDDNVLSAGNKSFLSVCSTKILDSKIELENCGKFSLFYQLISAFSLLSIVGLIFSAFSRSKSSEYYQSILRLMLPDQPNIQTNATNVDSLLDELVSKEKEILSYRKQIEEIKENDLLIKITKQVAHDIRSPLESLKTAITLKNTQLSALSIKQIEKIADNLLRNHKSSLSKEDKKLQISLQTLLYKSIQMKTLEKPDIQINLDLQTDCEITANESELLRVFSNIFNNSYLHSGSKLIHIETTKVSDNFIEIAISDNGYGFPVRVLQELATYKTSIAPVGNGIGLSSAIDAINSINGTISFSNNENRPGALIKIILPASHFEIGLKNVNPNKVILIDDNVLVSMSWKMYAEKIKMDVCYFNSTKSFADKMDSLDKNLPIYIDSELGESVQGNITSKKFFDYGFKNITLITGHASDYFREPMPWIREIRGKEFPFQLNH